MIYWAPFLHFYQPSFQFHTTLHKICDESYRPLLKMFLDNPKSKVTVNINGVLTELLCEHGANDIIDSFSLLAKRRQLEFVESSKFHAILPLIPQKEARYQLKLNRKINEKVFKKNYKPKGLFPPEMCYSQDLIKLAKSFHLEWILVSGIAHNDQWPLDFISCLGRPGASMNIIHRDDIVSNKISFKNFNADSFIAELIALTKGKKNAYLITAMDAETFGHHIKNWEQDFLAKVYKKINTTAKAKIKAVTISELIDIFPKKKVKPPRPSSWSTSEQDMKDENWYPLWLGHGNDLHRLQWQHLNNAIRLVEQSERIKGTNKETKHFAVIGRVILDKALVSCQFWWANKARGLFSVNMINRALLLQEESVLNAYKAISMSSLDNLVKEQYKSIFLDCRNIAGQIRDQLVR